MTKRLRDGTVVIEAENLNWLCELCGANEETRPYGPHNPITGKRKRVCFSCGMKNVDETAKAFAELLG